VRAGGGVAEHLDLAFLAQDVADGVVDEEDQPVRPLRRVGGHVAQDDPDLVAAGVAADQVEHGLGAVHAGDLHPALEQGQRDPAVADRELERGPSRRQLGEEVGSVVLVATDELVVLLGDVGSEVVERVVGAVHRVRHAASQPSRRVPGNLRTGGRSGVLGGQCPDVGTGRGRPTCAVPRPR
jgi:hypothetical protein